jgi:C-terminal processing protease CtpA/Prc
VTPVFQPSFPSSFVRRLGRSSDFFYSGTFTAGGKKIGYIRIPDFQDPSSGLEGFAINQFDTEMLFMRANTDGLVVDVMRNPGGDGCYAEALLQDLIPYRFRGIGNQIRVTQDMLLGLSQEIDQAGFFGFDQLTVDQLNFILSEMQTAYKQNRGITDPLPACGTYFERDPLTDSRGNSIAYTKPILLLTDEFTTSAAEIFAAIFQDSQRGPVFGWRTAGAGGSVGGAQISGFYSESYATVTLSQLVRTQHVLTPDFPITDYIENVGVRPDITLDYMTEDNLTNRGKAFVDGFVAAMVNLLQ